MARLQKESTESLSLRQQEMQQLTESIAIDEARMDEINEILMQDELLIPNNDSERLLREWRELNIRVDQAKIRLAQLKSPSELTPEDRARRQKKTDSKERFNITH